jgi:DNA-binding NtrC family response regulator
VGVVALPIASPDHFPFLAWHATCLEGRQVVWSRIGAHCFSSGIIVNLSIHCRQNYVGLPEIEELLRIFKRGRHEVQLEVDVRLEVALQALEDGHTYVEIMQTAVWQLEKGVIEQVLRFTNGNKSETARILKVDYKTLYRKIHRYF